MLPDDAQARRAAHHLKLQQTQVNDHFPTAQPEDNPPPYTDELFKEAAIEWLIQTDQVSSSIIKTAFFVHTART